MFFRVNGKIAICSPDINVHQTSTVLFFNCQLQCLKMFWEKSSAIRNSAVSDEISRKCFEKLLSVLHFRDNMNLPEHNHIVKVS